MSMATRLAVMDEGRIVQIGTPREVYERPATRFVADFIGIANIFERDGRDRRAAPGEDRPRRSARRTAPCRAGSSTSPTKATARSIASTPTGQVLIVAAAPRRGAGARRHRVARLAGRRRAGASEVSRTFGGHEHSCHPERSEGPVGLAADKVPRCARDDTGFARATRCAMRFVSRPPLRLAAAVLRAAVRPRARHRARHQRAQRRAAGRAGRRPRELQAACFTDDLYLAAWLSLAPHRRHLDARRRCCSATRWPTPSPAPRRRGGRSC